MSGNDITTMTGGPSSPEFDRAATPVRGWGRIKWFGGRNNKTGKENEFGFIESEAKLDLFVHKRDVLSPISSLSEGALVTFRTAQDPRSGNLRAREVRPLSEEIHWATIQWLMKSGKEDLVLAAFERYCLGVPSEESYQTFSEILKAPNSIDPKRILNVLPDQIFVAHPELRKYLLPTRLAKVCVEIYDRETDQLKKEELITELSKQLVSAGLQSTDAWNQIPDAAFRDDYELRQRMPKPTRIRFLLRWWNDHPFPNEQRIVLDELRDCLGDISSGIVDPSIFPRGLLSQDFIWCKLPVQSQVDLLMKMDWLDEKSASSAIGQVVMTLQVSDGYDRSRILSILPPNIKQDHRVFVYLPTEEQVEAAWRSIEDGSWSTWEWLSTKARLLSLFRAAKGNLPLPRLSVAGEKDPLVQVAYSLFWSMHNPEKRDAIFKRAHEIFQDHIVDVAWKSTDPLDLTPLLPHCRPRKVEYCEGRPWPSRSSIEGDGTEFETAFCPRTGRGCVVFSTDHSQSWSEDYGARLHSDVDQHWSSWSMLELLEVAGITPDLPELANPNEYVLKLSGWVNRLNEIRKRLKCSKCDGIMTPNVKYAVNLARYNTTVVTCPKGLPHDYNIYLNHCWGCHHIVDSRESTIKVDNFYICIHCGSGPLRSPTYTQGDVCPKCGLTSKMYTDKSDARRRRCRTCRHEIRVPPDHNRTGPGSSRT